MAALEIAWTLLAVRDVAEATAYIGADDPDAAQRWESRLIERLRRVAELPLSGRMVPELGRSDLREVIHGRHRLVYLVSASHIVVVRILEGHRPLPEDLANT